MPECEHLNSHLFEASRPRNLPDQKKRKIISKITQRNCHFANYLTLFLRGIWHIDAHFNPNDHKASLCINQLFFSFVTGPSPYSHFACSLADLSPEPDKTDMVLRKFSSDQTCVAKGKLEPFAFSLGSLAADQVVQSSVLRDLSFGPHNAQQ